MNDLIPTENGRKQSPWEKPGGKLGVVVLALVAGIILINATAIFAFVIKMLQNTITTVALIAVLVALIYVLANPKTWKVAELGYLLLMRKITGLFVTVDPIGIIREHVEDMKMRMSQMQSSLGKINGIIQLSERKLEEYHKKLEIEARRYKYYKESEGERYRMNDSQLLISTYEQVIKSREANLAKSKKWADVLRILYNYSDSKVKATTEYCNIKEEEYKLVREEYKAFSSAMSAMNGDPDKLAVFNMALDKVDEEIMTKTGLMDEILNETGGLMSQINADQAISSSKADEILKQLDEGTGIFSHSDWEVPDVMPKDRLEKRSSNNNLFNF